MDRRRRGRERVSITPGQLRAAKGHAVTPFATLSARAEIWRTPGRGEDDPEARALAAEADAAALAEVVAGYRRNLADARCAGDLAEAQRWRRALRRVLRADAAHPLRAELTELAKLVTAEALAESPYEPEDDPDPPLPIDAATTSPHRPCAPPTPHQRAMAASRQCGREPFTRKEARASRLTC